MYTRLGQYCCNSPLLVNVGILWSRTICKADLSFPRLVRWSQWTSRDDDVISTRCDLRKRQYPRTRDYGSLRHCSCTWPVKIFMIFLSLTPCLHLMMDCSWAYSKLIKCWTKYHPVHNGELGLYCYFVLSLVPNVSTTASNKLGIISWKENCCLKEQV